MGLHNRYPPYFYKRGNLFNTYLGYSDDQGSSATVEPKKPPRRKSPSRGSRKGQSSKPSVLFAERQAGYSREAAQAGARLTRFAREHLSLAETERLLQLIAARIGIAIESGGELDLQLPLELGRFVTEHVAPDVAARYSAALEQRLKRGEPLIQK